MYIYIYIDVSDTINCIVYYVEASTSQLCSRLFRGQRTFCKKVAKGAWKIHENDGSNLLALSTFTAGQCKVEADVIWYCTNKQQLAFRPEINRCQILWCYTMCTK